MEPITGIGKRLLAPPASLLKTLPQIASVAARPRCSRVQSRLAWGHDNRGKPSRAVAHTHRDAACMFSLVMPIPCFRNPEHSVPRGSRRGHECFSAIFGSHAFLSLFLRFLPLFPSLENRTQNMSETGNSYTSLCVCWAAAAQVRSEPKGVQGRAGLSIARPPARPPRGRSASCCCAARALETRCEKRHCACRGSGRTSEQLGGCGRSMAGP